MRLFCPAQGRFSYPRGRGSNLQWPTALRVTTHELGASSSSTLFCSRIGRTSQQRGHSSGECQKPWQNQWQKLREEQGKKTWATEWQKPCETKWQKPGETGVKKPGETKWQKPGEAEWQKPLEKQWQKPWKQEGEKPWETKWQKLGEAEWQKPWATEWEKLLEKPWEKPLENQWQKPWEKQGKKAGQVSGQMPNQESSQASGQVSRQDSTQDSDRVSRQESRQGSSRQSSQEPGQKSGQGQHGSRNQHGWQWTVPPHRGRAPLLAAAQTSVALGTAAFVKLSENEEASGDTGERRMLQASRKEIAKKVDEDDRGLSRLRHKVVYFLDLFVWEPLCTGFRFLHLALIFVPVILAVPAIWIGRRQKDRNNERSGTLWWYGFLVKGMEWAGPAFIKLGQWAASRSDIFPTELCEIMSKLHSDAPAHSMHATRRIVQAAFGSRPFEDIFDEFDEKPLGVGAIAQVYRAKLKPDLAGPGDADLLDDKPRGTIRKNVTKNVGNVLKSTPKRVPSSFVAVKVLHPGVERTVRRDLRIMRAVASVLNLIPTIEWLSLPDEVEQFGEMMKLQLDMRIEAANLTIFRKNFKNRTTAWFPFPYTEFTTRNVLIEEFAHGMPLADFLENGGGVFQRDIASEGLDAFLRMLLLDNFIHADLHPGNIMVRFYEAEQPELPLKLRLRYQDGEDQALRPEQNDVTEKVLARLRPFRHQKDPEAWNAELAKIDREGYRPQLIFIDTGLVTELNETNRKNFLDLFRAVAEFDGYKAGNLMCERCRQPDAVINKEIFALKMQHLVLGVKSQTLALGNLKIGDILEKVLDMVRSHHVRLEGDFVNVVISIFLLEGIGRTLDPNTDLLSSSLPILRQLSAQQGKDMAKGGDFSMLILWMGLETRRFLQISIDDVERCVKYDLLSPNV